MGRFEIAKLAFPTLPGWGSMSCILGPPDRLDLP